MIAMIDNYDSFTYNIVQMMQRVSGQEVRVLGSRNCTLQDLINLNADYLVIGPGPGNPSEAGVSLEAIKYFAGKMPILGVCLGHQAIGQAFGGKIVHAKNVCHGKAEQISLDGKGVYRFIGKNMLFTRYHSLVIEEASLPAELEVTARAADGDIMGVRHKHYAIEGVQFHPESIASKSGEELFKAFFNFRRENLPVAQILNTVIAGNDLDEETAALFMENLTEGGLDERQTAAILTALAAKGPAASELAGCARVLCSKKTPFPADNTGLAEIVGTGGDGKGSFNISSLSALVAASCGAKMAKHGNKAVSSKSGAADFYSALGININTAPAKTAEVLTKTNFCFLMAPIYHSAMRFAAPVRAALGIKTIMNCLGPLTNPAGAQYQMLGVYSQELLEPIAKASKALGAKRVMVIASQDGFDEISPCAKTNAFLIDEDGSESRFVIDPEEFGVCGCDVEELAGGTGMENAQLAIDVMNNKGRNTIKMAVCLNAGAVLYVSKVVPSIKEGFELAKNALESGAVLKKLEEVKAASNAE